MRIAARIPVIVSRFGIWQCYHCHMTAAPVTTWLDVARLLGLSLGRRASSRSSRAAAPNGVAPTFTAAVREGLPFSAIDALARGSGLPVDEIASTLRIPARTYARRKSAGRFGADESDRLSRLARTATLALAVLDGRERASAWLTTRNRALGGETPLSLLDTDVGTARVEEILQRIRHGIAS